jgi:hypothetical protein
MRESIVLLALIATSAAAAAATPQHRASDEAVEVRALIRKGTADSLATASLLVHFLAPEDENRAGPRTVSPDPEQLIKRAVMLARQRPELLWLELRDCEQRRCPQEQAIATRLQAVDPDNGFAWLADLRTMESLATPEATQVIETMAAAPVPRLYWNKLVVVLFDALTHHDPAVPATAITSAADDRLSHVTGVLSAVDVPAVQPVVNACRLDQMELPGRRAACTRLMTRLETSDSIVGQNLSWVLQESWWPVGSPQRATVHLKRLQQRYRTVASNRLRPGQADRDAEVRVDEMRRLAKEEDVERAMLAYFHEPLERPEGWREPTAPQ